MKIAITATGPALDDLVDARFGRCACFLLVDPDSGELEAIENPNIAMGGGTGIQSAQLMADKGVQTVLTGNCGPNAFRVLGAAGIHVTVGVSGRVRDALEQYKRGELVTAGKADVTSHFGMLSALAAVVDALRCTGCARCRGTCPHGAIEIGQIAAIDPAACTGCGRCMTECPQDAISLRNRQ